MGRYRLAVDIGGTFTDVVLETPEGAVSSKVLTTPDAPERGVVSGVREILDSSGIDPQKIEHAIHGTTLATNALIERRGARTALITTQGFRDTLEFAFGHRFDQYDLEMRRPAPLIPRPWRLEVPERMSADGDVLLALDEAAVRQTCATLRDEGIEAVAVCFLHAYRNPAHENRVRDIVREECPDLYVSLSHEVCPEIREYERTSTTAANAYVQPRMAGYLKNLEARLAEIGLVCPLLMIMSAGSLTSVETAIRFPVRLVESGPAGGAILAQHVARQIGAAQSVALDMGGTTAKIILLNDYEPRHSRSMEVARAYRFLPGSGLPLRIPVIDLIEIGAGGGSIAHVDPLGRIVVGPESAGASPGPACYGLGGDRATVTDANLVLGKFEIASFSGGSLTLDPGRAEGAIERSVATPAGIEVVAAAGGIIEIVDEHMANATRVHAADSGDQVETRVLIATGGAAPLHAARIAQKLGIETVIVPQGAGVGSAHGFLRAPVAYEAVRSKLVSLDAFDAGAVNALYADLRAEAEAVLRHTGPAGGGYVERRLCDMRYRGQGHDLSVELPARDYTDDDASLIEELFAQQYAKNYSRTIANLGVQALTWTLVLSVPGTDEDHGVADTPEPALAAAEIAGEKEIFDAELGRFVNAAIVRRDTMRPGSSVSGPAIIVERQTTTYVPNGYAGHMNAQHHLVLVRRTQA